VLASRKLLSLGSYKNAMGDVVVFGSMCGGGKGGEGRGGERRGEMMIA